MAADEEADAAYDVATRALAVEARGVAGDRVLGPEEQAERERLRMEMLEKERWARVLEWVRLVGRMCRVWVCWEGWATACWDGARAAAHGDAGGGEVGVQTMQAAAHARGGGSPPAEHTPSPHCCRPHCRAF